MNQSFFSETIVRRPALFRAMLRFNGAFEAGQPPEDLSGIPGLNAAALWQSPTVRNLFPEEHQSANFWDFTEESRRLALLEPDTLAKLSRYFGVAVHAQAIALCVARDDVLALRNELGPELYAYALYRGRYQLGGLSDFFGKMHAKLPLVDRILLHGAQALALIRSMWPETLRQLAPETGQGHDAPLSPLPEVTHELQRALWFGLKKLLLKEVAPEWAPCFN